MPGIGIGIGLSLGGGGGGGASARSATVATTAGVVYTVGRLLGSASTLALISGTNGNLTLNAASGAISATAAIAAAASQTAVVREVNGQLAVEYPVTLTGAAPAPTPTPTPTPGYSFTNAEAAALYARDNTIAPRDTRKQAIDILFGALKVGAASGSNILAKLDVLRLYAAASQSAAVLNWLGTPFAGSIGGGAPVFVVDRGFWTDGVDDWLDTGFAPSAGVQFQQDSATFGAFFRKSAANTNQPCGTNTSNAISLTPRNATGIPAARLNSTSAVVTGPAVTSGYGLTAVSRSGTALTLYQKGVQVGTATGSSSARSTVNIGFGKQGTTFGDGQFCAFFAGASLSAAEHADVNAAIGSYLTTLGVAEIVPTARTLALASGISLPDGSNPYAATKGMASTGLIRRADGKWYVGNGLAGRSDLYWTRMSADLLTIEQEFKASTLGLSTDFQGSIQGLALDTSDNTMWAILKLAGASGATTYLLHFGITTEALIGPPVQIAASDTGVAYDALIDKLWITRDGGAAAGTLVLYDKAGVAQTLPIGTPGDTDQCFYVQTTSGNFLAGDLLVSAGANGSDGTVTVFNRLDYGGMIARRVDTLTAAQQIEGVVLSGSTYYVCNDGATHPGARAKNEVLTYAA